MLPTVLAWGKDVLWVDARPAEEYHLEHVPGAILLNLEGWDQLFPSEFFLTNGVRTKRWWSIAVQQPAS